LPVRPTRGAFFGLGRFGRRRRRRALPLVLAALRVPAPLWRTQLRLAGDIGAGKVGGVRLL